MASAEYAVRNIYGELKEYVDKNVGVIDKKFRRMSWKKHNRYIDRRKVSIRQEKRWK